MLVDAKKGFNELKRYLLLWQCVHQWRRGGQFVFNCYRHKLIAYARGQVGDLLEVILSSEGVAQGCTFGMYTYCVGLMTLL